MFKIDKDIHVPAPGRLGATRKYPWWDMEVGDSLFVPGKTTSQISPTVGGFSRRSGRKFTMRKLDDVVRVWRIE